MEHPAYPSAATLAREKRAFQAASEIIVWNEKLAAILIRAVAEIIALPTIHCMTAGLDFIDIAAAISDMHPDISTDARLKLIERMAEEDQHMGDNR